MTEPIFDTEYWKGRLSNAIGMEEVHRAVFETTVGKWREIAETHRRILKDLIQPADSILDCGCGWGRLLSLMPDTWQGFYAGVDISPDFIKIASRNYGGRYFGVVDLRRLDKDWFLKRSFAFEFDWAILISVRPMVIRNAGQETWNVMEKNIRQVAKKLLYLEYDPDDKGSVE